MASPSSRAVAVGGALLLLLVFAVPTTFLYLTSAPAASSPSLLLNLKPFGARCAPAAAAAPPLRVFMYDLPRRFHVGMMDAAEAFFVPFFSSLSFNVHGRNMTDPETEADRLLQVQ
jgi:hypothetical protein